MERFHKLEQEIVSQMLLGMSREDVKGRYCVNHGESSRCLDLASSLHKLNKVETNAPRNLETLRLR